MDIFIAFTIGIISSVTAAFLYKKMDTITLKGCINKPSDGDYAEMDCKCRGTAKKNRTKHLYLVVSSSDSNMFFPQVHDSPLQVDHNNEWIGSAWLGNEKSTGEKYRILLVLVNTCGKDIFDLYKRYGQTFNQYFGLPKLPEGTTVLNEITVIRK